MSHVFHPLRRILRIPKQQHQQQLTKNQQSGNHAFKYSYLTRSASAASRSISNNAGDPDSEERLFVEHLKVHASDANSTSLSYGKEDHGHYRYDDDTSTAIDESMGSKIHVHKETLTRHHSHNHDHDHENDEHDSNDNEDEDMMEDMFVDPHYSLGHDRQEWGGPTRGGRFSEPTRFGVSEFFVSSDNCVIRMLIYFFLPNSIFIGLGTERTMQ